MPAVGLIRGINVGGASRVAKADLAAAFEAAGFREVVTLLQSGNVVFAADAAPTAEDARSVTAELHRRSGVDAGVVLLPEAEFRRVAAANPLSGDDDARLVVTFLDHDLPADVVAPDAESIAPEELRLGKRAVYQWCPLGVSKSRVKPAFWRSLGPVAKISQLAGSSGANPFACIAAGIACLWGPAHGGANEAALKMLEEIGTPEQIPHFIARAKDKNDPFRLMGFGHRIYRVRDPRADALKAALGRLERVGAVDADRIGLADAVETAALAALRLHKPDRRLDTNVEFYTAILLDALAIPREAFTPIFATGRVAGWTAHAMEQQRKGRLLRPAAVYTGPMPKG